MKKEINLYNLISSLIMLVIGVILITNPNMLIGTISWIIGCLLLLAGIIKSIMSLKNNELDTISLYVSIVIIIVGILLITFPGIVSVMIKLLFGSWILLAGIQRLSLALALKSVDSKGSNTYLFTSLIMVVIGVLVLINFYNLIGLLLIIYAIMDIINYIYYSIHSTKYTTVTNLEKKSKNKNKKVSKNIKDKKAIDALIEEE